MEKTIKPDRKYMVKATWIMLTITGGLLLIAGIMSLIFVLTGNSSKAVIILWIIFAGTILVIWAISWPIMFLWIKNLQYVIYDDRVSIHKGVLTKTIQNIPFRAITDFALVRTLYDRALKIGSIKIQTAGKSAQSPSMYEGVLGGLSEFDSLHAELRTKIRTLHPLIDNPVTTADVPRHSQDFLLKEILDQLKEIQKDLRKG
jgi:uncharacterized membrane protein YdbT with pleckstrin-like domain